MLAPTPVLKPSPLDLGDVFAGTFEILKRRFGSFLALSALVMAFPIVILIGGGLFGLYGGVTARLTTLTPGAIAGGVLLLMVALVLMGLAQLKAQGMLSLGAYEVAQGGRPDLAGLWTRSKGFLPRLVPAMLVIGLAVVGLYAVFGLVFFGTFTAMTQTGPRGSSGDVLGFALLFVAVMIAFGVFAVVASIKLLYLAATAAIEGTGGMAAIGRSWKLTNGAFWRTFGFYFLGSLLASFAAMPVSFLSQAMLAPLLSWAQTPSQDDLLTVIPVMLLLYGVQFTVQILVLPFITTYVTVMFLDQVRRSEQPVEPSWVPGQPQGFYAQGWTSPPPSTQGWTSPPPASQTWSTQPPQAQGWTSQPPQAQGWTPPPPYDQPGQGQNPWPPQQPNWPGPNGYPPQQP